MIEAKNCPFCGQPADVKWNLRLQEFVVGCVNKDCPALEMPMVLVADWNRRVDADKSAECTHEGEVKDEEVNNE